METFVSGAAIGTIVGHTGWVAYEFAMTRSFLALLLLFSFSPACIIVSDDDDGEDTDGFDSRDDGSPPAGVDESGDGPATCQVGAEGCPCTSGGMCNAPFMCNDNLNICVADLCPVGTEGCSCTPRGACDPDLVCASGLCVSIECTPGSEACQCTDGGGCDPGLVCLSDHCVDPDSGGSTTGDGSSGSTSD